MVVGTSAEDEDDGRHNGADADSGYAHTMKL